MTNSEYIVRHNATSTSLPADALAVVQPFPDQRRYNEFNAVRRVARNNDPDLQDCQPNVMTFEPGRARIDSVCLCATSISARRSAWQSWEHLN